MNRRSGTNVFLFEGAGSDNSIYKRYYAMCVVVTDGAITHIDRNSTTIPDFPFEPSRNGGDPMPTLCSGIYRYTEVNHNPSGYYRVEGYSNYAAIKIRNLNGAYASVLRFTSKTSYQMGVSDAIHAHARWRSGISASGTPNSQGCMNIGGEPIGGGGNVPEYLDFCKAVGILSKSRTSMNYHTQCEFMNVSGRIVIDRSLAGSYLLNVGYPSGALQYLQ